MVLDRDALERLLHQEQDGVVSRHQVLELGATAHEVERLLRRRDLFVAVPGVYVEHNGPLTPAQRAWVAVLACWPSALSHQSALPDPPEGPVHVAVGRDRSRLQRIPGVRVHRTADLDGRVAWHRRPPRVRVEHAVIDVASEQLASGSTAAAFETLARTCRSRLTTPARIADALASRPRIAERRLLADLLADLADGACSVLERGFQQLERAHGLPRGERQVRRRADGRTTYVDVRYRRFGRIVELDGRAFHDGPRARDADAARDLANLVDRAEVTARLTHGLVFTTPCQTAARLAAWLQAAGWTGQLTRCDRCRQAA